MTLGKSPLKKLYDNLGVAKGGVVGDQQRPFSPLART